MNVRPGWVAVAWSLAAWMSVAGCSKRAANVCPEGMEQDPGKSQSGERVWCRSRDGQTARWIEFHGGESRRQSCGYARGRPEGSYTAWHPGGQPWIQGEYRDGLKAGRWTQYDKDGRKVAEGEYRAGEFIAGAPVGLPAQCEKQTP